jgi:hypothetical protein
MLTTISIQDLEAILPEVSHLLSDQDRQVIAKCAPIPACPTHTLIHVEVIANLRRLVNYTHAVKTFEDTDMFVIIQSKKYENKLGAVPINKSLYMDLCQQPLQEHSRHYYRYLSINHNSIKRAEDGIIMNGDLYWGFIYQACIFKKQQAPVSHLMCYLEPDRRITVDDFKANLSTVKRYENNVIVFDKAKKQVFDLEKQPLKEIEKSVPDYLRNQLLMLCM